MANKVKVTGKAQNRTALGILHAYMAINPDASLAGLRKAFPNTLCPDAGVKELLLPVVEAETFNTKMGLYFTKPDEVITLKDGSKIALAQVWSKASLDKIIAQAAQLEIEVDEIDKSIKNPGGFSLEYINGFTPGKQKKGCFGILLIPIAIAAAIIALC